MRGLGFFLRVFREDFTGVILGRGLLFLGYCCRLGIFFIVI